MGIFDRFKRKKEDKKEVKPKKEASAEKDVKYEKVIGADGKLTTAARKTKAEPKKIKPKKEDTGEAWRILIKPVTTEKVTGLGVFNQYAFEVAPRANKIEVRRAIKNVYGFDPIKVNVINVSGKEVRYGKSEGKTKHWKKAIITLSPGQKIEF